MKKQTPPPEELSTGYLLRIFLPLSLSDMIMVVSGPLIGVVLGRLPDVKVHLAAYGAAQTLSILLESPIIMMLQAATAASASAVAFAALGRLMWVFNGAITALYALVAFTPLFGWVAGPLLGLPAAVAGAAHPAFVAMLLWPAAIGYRRYWQGFLIRHRRSRDVMNAGFARLAGLTFTLITAAAAGLPGATVAGLGLSASVIGEAAAVAYFARRLRRELAALPEPDAGAVVPETMAAQFWWYLPLASTQVLVWLARPAMTAGIARADLADLSLAAWPIAWMTVVVVANGTRMIQQLTISLVRDAASARRIRAFTLQVGLAFSLAMALLAFTPLAHGYLQGVLGLPAELARVSRPVLMIAAVFPMAAAAQSWLQGLLVKSGQTGRVNLAAFVGGVVTVALVFTGAGSLGWSGATIAAAAAITGIAVEVGVLWGFSHGVRRSLDLGIS